MDALVAIADLDVTFFERDGEERVARIVRGKLDCFFVDALGAYAL